MVTDYGTDPDSCQPVSGKRVYRWHGRLLNALLSATCRLCGGAAAGSGVLCRDCLAELPRLGPGCLHCARPVPGMDTARPCGHCQRRPPGFDRTTALYRYRPPLDFLLKRLKYSGDLGLPPLFAGQLARHLLARHDNLPQLLVPVPLHPARQRERGYNQAIEIARPLGKALGIPVNHGLCRRTRRTDAQALLGPTARRLNMRNAFAVDSHPVASHLAIIDDVMTTGCTAGELARVLKRAGADVVEVWVIARAA